MIRACLQVLRTYTSRWRFWIFGGVYLLIAVRWGPDVDNFVVVVSAALAAIVGCFVALHLRRQFASPAAKLLPHFAIPHLIVGGVASLALWVGVPIVQAHLLGLHFWGPMGVYAFAGMFLALVVCWRQAIVLLAALPVAIVGSQASFVVATKSMGQRFIAGDYPADSAILIALAALAQPAAAWYLLRMSDQDVSVSDDFAVEAPRTDRGIGRFDELLLTFRDAAVRHRLADVGHGLWAIQRWRIPVVVSWVQLALAVAIGVLLTVVAWVGSGHPGAALTAVVVTMVGMLIAPFNGWHMRRGALGMEFMRPVARFQYFYEIAAAVAFDVCLWSTLASFFGCLGFYLIAHSDPQVFAYMGVLLSWLWSAAVLFYGVGLATFRLRYWLPVMIGVVLGWTVMASIAVGAYAAAVSSMPPHSASPVVVVSSLSWVLGGLAIAAATLARWSWSDLG